MTAPFTFTLPEELSAKEPPERRGVARDRVRPMVIDRRDFSVAHTRFDHLGEYLRAGDLLVFNSSRTLPAVQIRAAELRYLWHEFGDLNLMIE